MSAHRKPKQASTAVSRLLAQRNIFEVVLHRGPISRAELSKLTGLSKQTTSEVMDVLERKNLVRSVGKTRGNIGRTAVLYEVNPQGGHVLGIDLGGSKLTVALADISSRGIAELTEPTDKRGGRFVLQQISGLASRISRTAGTQTKRLRSIVVGMPGVLNRVSGAIELSPNISALGEVNVKATLQDRLGGPVVIENDVNLALMGEIWHGCARDFNSVGLLALGTGVGLGLAINGKLVRGAHGAAGEIGYLPLGGDPMRPEVQKQGCLEYEIGAAGILRRYRTVAGHAPLSVPAIFELLSAGDNAAQQVVDATARLVAMAAIAIVTTTDPDLLVLGGSIGSRPEILERVKTMMAAMSPLRGVELRSSQLGHRGGVIGALAVALSAVHQELFGVPEITPALALPAQVTSTSSADGRRQSSR
jgi:predicted NBD/HSP70 family sugar kinase/predicted transcriptional regulator